MDLWEQTVKYVDKLGVVLILILVIVGGFKKWWVFGYQHAEKSRECDEWKSLALSTHLANRRLEKMTDRAVETMEHTLQAKTGSDSSPNPQV